MIDLQEAEAIDQLIAGYLASVTGKGEQRHMFDADNVTLESESRELELGQRLRTAVFDPLLPFLGDCRRLFLSPDGDLNKLPFEVLPAGDNGGSSKSL